jgi:uncharacterized membrane protein (DUF485 family)
MPWSKSKRNVVEIVGTAIASPALIMLLFFVGAPRTVFYPTLLLGPPIIAATGMGAVAADGILAFFDTWIVLLILVKLFGIFMNRKREIA